MANRVIMPKQGLQMTEGTIVKWLRQEGEPVKAGEPFFEMETDKLTITMDAEVSGTLLKIVKQEGEVVPITELIAIVGEPGEDYSALLREGNGEAAAEAEAPAPEQQETAMAAPEKAPEAGGRVFASPRAKLRAAERGVSLAAVKGSGPQGLIVERDILAFSAQKATPLARKLAEQAGVSLETIEGTGPRGKVVKEDVARLACRPETSAPKTDKIIPLKGMRKIIAHRMRESLSTNAQAMHQIRVDMTNAATLRKAYQEKQQKISYNDLIVKAVSTALEEFPILNAEMREDAILLKSEINVGVAVAMEDGLIVPNLKNTNFLRLAEIGEQTRSLAEKAKTGALAPEDYAGGTFTVSNLGMFGLDSFTAIINPPEAGILAVGKIEKTPVVMEEEIVIRPMMSLTLSYDHRIVDGAPAAQFLQTIKQYLENPVLML